MVKQWLILILVASVLCLPAAAQIVTGSIVGTVEDPSGAAVLGADITLIHKATGRERTARTSETGGFVVSGLDAGEYSLQVTADGFKRVEKSGLMLATGERLPAGVVVLELGAITETVSVTAEAAPVRTESAENAGVITSEQAEYLPTLGRSVDNLVTLMPGVVNPGNDPESFDGGGNYRVLGSRSRSNSISIDGVVVTDADSGGGKRLSVSQDAVAEVKILISNYQAEYGRMSASNLEVVTKSGTRDFHGLASYFKRHEQFNAGNFFDNRLGRSKPIYRYNTFNYNLGGPVSIPRVFNTNRDKMFFFWGQEFWPTSTGFTVQRTMPTELERLGDFSQSIDQNDKLIVIKDPLNGGKAFPGNVIPATRVNANGQALLNVFDVPNFFDRSISKGAYNYINTSTRDLPQRTDTLKLDYNFTENHRLSGTYSGYYATVEGFNFAGANANWPQIKGNYKNPTYTYGLRYTGVFSPTVINEFHVGWLHRDETNDIDPESLARNQRDKIGFTVGQLHPEINPLNLIPNATFGGVTGAATLAYDGRFPFDFFQNLVNMDEKLTIIRGPHTFKAGLYVEYFDRNMPVQGLLFGGQFDFGRNVNNALDTGYAYSNAMLGVYNTYSEASAKPRMHTRSWTADFFVQDNWKVTPRLVLDVGVRMQWLPWIKDRDDLIAGFSRGAYDPSQAVLLMQPGFDAQGKRAAVNPLTGATAPATFIGAMVPDSGNPFNGMVVPAFDSSIPRALAKDPPLHFAPRFGFAYDVFGNGKTAVRGGFGMLYNREAMAHAYKWMIAQPPLVENPVLYYGTFDGLLDSSSVRFPSSVLARDPEQKGESIMNYSIGLEQNIGFDTIMSVYYVGALGRNLFWRQSINPVPAGANFDPANADPTLNNKPLSPAFLRPITGYNDIFYFEGAASSNYHSMQTTARRRFTKGFQFGAAWTWSKAMDYNEDPRAIGADATVNPFVHPRVWMYGPMSWDRTHTFKLNYVWSVPKVTLGNKVADYVVNDWQVSGITTFESGQPLGIGLATTVSTDFTGTPSQGARVDHVADAVLPKSERTFTRYFNTAAVAMPAVGTFGNSAKALLRGPGANNWDVAIFKNFPIRESVRLQFRWEMYNAFNHTQFSAVDTTARFDPQGNQVNARFGELTGADPARRMQFGLRLSF